MSAGEKGEKESHNYYRRREGRKVMIIAAGQKGAEKPRLKQEKISGESYDCGCMRDGGGKP